jgi:hypothetical protein
MPSEASIAGTGLPEPARRRAQRNPLHSACPSGAWCTCRLFAPPTRDEEAAGSVAARPDRLRPGPPSVRRVALGGPVATGVRERGIPVGVISVDVRAADAGYVSYHAADVIRGGRAVARCRHRGEVVGTTRRRKARQRGHGSCQGLGCSPETVTHPGSPLPPGRLASQAPAGRRRRDSFRYPAYSSR